MKRVFKYIDLGVIIFFGSLLLGSLFAYYVYSEIKLSEKAKIEIETIEDLFEIEMEKLGIDSIQFITKENEYVQSFRNGRYWALVDYVILNGIETSTSNLLSTTDYFLTCDNEKCYIYIYIPMKSNKHLKQRLSVKLTFSPSKKYEVFDKYGHQLINQNSIQSFLIQNEYRNSCFEYDDFGGPPK